MTYREDLEARAEDGDPDALAEFESLPPLPEDGEYLWAYFTDLHATRPSNGMGPCRIPRTEIAAWQDQECVLLRPWEIRAITSLDSAWVAAQAGHQPKPKPASEQIEG